MWEVRGLGSLGRGGVREFGLRPAGKGKSEPWVSVVAEGGNYSLWAADLLGWFQDGNEGPSNALLLAMIVELLQCTRKYVHASEGHLKNGASNVVPWLHNKFVCFVLLTRRLPARVSWLHGSATPCQGMPCLCICIAYAKLILLYSSLHTCYLFDMFVYLYIYISM